MRRAAWLAACLALLVALAGCDTILRSVVVPAVENLVEDIKNGDDPPGNGHGRGGSKDTTSTPAPEPPPEPGISL